mgnify:CR=1 FL=1
MLIAITMLNVIGMTVVLPVLPFVLARYVPDQSHLAIWVGILEKPAWYGWFGNMPERECIRYNCKRFTIRIALQQLLQTAFTKTVANCPAQLPEQCVANQ